MAIRTPPPVKKEVDPLARRSPAPPSPPSQFAPAAPLRQPARSAAASDPPQAQREKKQRQASQESAADRERLAEQPPSGEPLAEQPLTRDLLNANDERRAREESGDERPPGDVPRSDALLPDAAEGGGQERGPGAGENIKEQSALGEAGGADLDMKALAEELLPPAGDNGIFEVTLPNGQKMGVAVNVQPGNIRYHLSTSDEKMSDRLRQRKMELQGHLERRIQRNVEIILL